MSAPYPPGQPQWPENRPRRPPPIQFRPEEPKPQGSKWLAWSLRIAGLVAVAVISGLVWWYINNDGPRTASGDGGETSQQSEGAYKFTAHKDLQDPQTEKNCAKHAYGQTEKFFQQHPCDRLTRALYVTEVPDGRTVYTSVSVVRMPDEASAAQLRKLIDTDKTGNVKDLVREGEVTIDGMDSLTGGGGYKSKQQGRDVVIAESDFDPKEKKGAAKAEEKQLDDVCDDALRLGTEVTDNAG